MGQTDALLVVPARNEPPPAVDSGMQFELDGRAAHAAVLDELLRLEARLGFDHNR